MLVYRGTGNGKRDAKNIGTYYTSDIDEAKFYGPNITQREIADKYFLTISNEELEQLNEIPQKAEILAAMDAKTRGYEGVIFNNIVGEYVKRCDYIIVF